MMEIILFIAVLLQILAAYLAVRLIRLTEVRAAWILIATGLVLMVIGRIVDILPFFAMETSDEINLLNDFVDVFISIVMVAGVALLTPLFYSIRQSERALRESEERYRTLVENVNAGVYRSTGDLEGRFLQVNPAMAKIFGYESPEEFKRVSIIGLYRDPEGRGKFVGKIKEFGYVRNEELELRKRDGTPIKVSVTAAAQYDEGGEIKWIDGVTEDITERKLAEEKLRESEQRLHRVIQGSPIPTFVIGKDHKVIYWNKALEELSGICSVDVIGTKQHWKAFYKEERPCMADLLVAQALDMISQWYPDKYIKSGLIEEAYEATDFFPELGARGKWLRFTAAAIRDIHGDLVGAIESLEDITERKQAEAVIRESEEKYRSLATTADSMYMIDRNFRYILMNEKHLSRFGLPLDKILGRCYSDFHSEEASREFAEKAEYVFQSGESVQHEYRSERDGRYFLRTFSPVKSPDARITMAVTVVSKDVSDRKQIEEKLKESEQRLYNVIQGSAIPSFVVGKDHKVLYWNKALEELTGIKGEDVVGKTEHWRAFYREERPCMVDLLVEGALNDIPNWYDGKYIKSRLIDEAYEATDFFPELGDTGKWLRFTAAVIRDSQGNLVGAIETLEDVTEHKQAEEELIRVKKLESLGIFAGGIAHDFNNLLSVMLRNIVLAKLCITDEQQEAMGTGLEIAEKVGHQAKELAHRLIAFAKGGEPIRKIGSISQLLRNSADLSLSGSNVTCEFYLPEELWPVEMDDVQIRQVIQNLVVNAREAMPGGGTITIRAENMNVEAGNGLPLKEGKYVKWSVRDHGIGIPRDDLGKIFDPYFTTKPTGTVRGMGLGLAICYSIIKKHDGFIDVESEPGAGSTFFVYLPASPQDDVLKKAGRDKTFKKGGKILVMNDEDTIRNATGVVLNYLGYDVEYARNGNDAIALYKLAEEKRQPFSAVILDLNVPGGMGGREALKELLAINPRVKAIISCGYSDDSTVSELSNGGSCRTVEIPYDIEKMKDILDNLIK